MASVVIKCPNTDKEVNTGLSMDRMSFESATLSNNSVKCPHCGQTHTWNKSDAFLK